jgi:indolepyruvate ferredoxin oxidoreductase
VTGAPGPLSRAAAEGLYRVMAYKDEYEVARLHAAATYGEKPIFHMSPPLLHRMDPATGRRGKIAIPGSIALPLFRVLRHGKAVRGTALDPFGYQAERRQERALIDQYIGDLRTLMAGLTRDNLSTAAAIAELPDQIRGFGPVKDANREKAQVRRTELLEAFARPVTVAMAAE